MTKVSALAGLLLLSVAACSTLPSVDVQPSQKLHVDAYLLQPCMSLSNLPENPTKTDVLTTHLLDGMSYGECAAKQAALANILLKQVESEK